MQSVQAISRAQQLRLQPDGLKPTPTMHFLMQAGSFKMIKVALKLVPFHTYQPFQIFSMEIQIWIARSAREIVQLHLTALIQRTQLHD